MAFILNIESATSLCSVSLAEDGQVISFLETLEERSHAKLLSVYIDRITKEAGILPKDLDAVAVGKGPGSYTGLRIGVSTAKGICFGAEKPLIAVGTLEIICHQFINGNNISNASLPDDICICPMIDAKRMEVYYALFDKDGNALNEVSAKVIDQQTFYPLLEKSSIFFMGSGMPKCRNIIDHPNAVFIDDVHPSSVALAKLSWKAFRKKEFEDTAYFEPFYLKDFVTTVPKNKFNI